MGTVVRRLAAWAAAALLLCAASARADTLGQRFGALRSLVEGRIAEIPDSGVTGREKKEKALLAAALALLDADSPTLDADADLAAKALGLLKKARSPILDGPAAFALRTDLYERVQDLHDNPDYLPFYFNPALGGKLDRLAVVAQFVIGKGFFARDAAGAAKAFLKAVRLVRKLESTAALGLKPARADALKVSIGLGPEEEFHDSRRGAASVSATYDPGADLATFDFTVGQGGAARHIVAHLPAPGPGSVGAEDPSAILEVDGFDCGFDLVFVSFSFSAWDPASGLAAGSFDITFFHPDPPGSQNEVPCAAVYGVFTIRHISVLP